jgi:hypothetical protein
LHHYTAIAEQLISEGKVIELREFGSGNINDTYLVSRDMNEENHFVLQRINTQVFKQPKLIMQNMRAFTKHMRRRARDEGHPAHNLQHALVQFKLTESIETHEHDIRNIIRSMVTPRTLQSIRNETCGVTHAP